MFKLCDAIKIGIENGSNRVSWIFKRAWSVRTQLKKREERFTKRFFFTGCYSNNVLSRTWNPDLSVRWLMRGSNAAASSSQAVDWQVRVAQRSPNVNYNLRIALNRPWWAKQQVCLGSPWLSHPDDLTGESASCLSFGEPNWWSGRCTGTQTRVHSEGNVRERKYQLSQGVSSGSIVPSIVVIEILLFQRKKKQATRHIDMCGGDLLHS